MSSCSFPCHASTLNLGLEPFGDPASSLAYPEPRSKKQKKDGEVGGSRVQAQALRCLGVSQEGSGTRVQEFRLQKDLWFRNPLPSPDAKGTGVQEFRG